jgi:hypothetical protein
MKKYLLREHFSIELNGEVLAGPIELELDEKTANANAHKLEELKKVEAVEKKKGKSE